MANRFRNILPFVVPRWLSTGDGEKVLFTLGMLKDAATERMRQGLEARFPSRAPETALDLMSADRGISRGRDETAEHFAQRLIAWRWPRGHRVRGSAFAALEQVSEYFGAIEVSSIDINGNLHTRTVRGVESYSYGNAWDWDGLGAGGGRARFWLTTPQQVGTFSEQPNLGDPDLWGGGYNEGYSLGIAGMTDRDAEAIRNLFQGDRPWKPAGSRSEWWVISIDGTAIAPDGTWATWSYDDAGTRRPTRPAGLRFISLTPEANNTFTGDGTVFSTASEMPDGSTYTAVATFHASTTLPDGSTHNLVSSYTASVLLFDDGNPTHFDAV